MNAGRQPKMEICLAGAWGSVSGRRTAPAETSTGQPLIVAIHGGGSTSGYFDVPGFSLLDRAAASGLCAFALDRPGYGSSTALPADEATILRNAEVLDDAIGGLWAAEHGDAHGIVLVGHSIGGAVAVAIAARQPSWPLLGLAISGVGLVSPPEINAAWGALPQIPMIELPGPLRDRLMFGPVSTYESPMPEASHIAHASAPRRELIDIVTMWPTKFRSIAGQVSVPLHYRQAEFDPLWITDKDQVHSFGEAFSSSPQVDARLFPASGHCIDFHRVGAAFQLEQLAFAKRCAGLA